MVHNLGEKSKGRAELKAGAPRKSGEVGSLAPRNDLAVLICRKLKEQSLWTWSPKGLVGRDK